MMRRRRQLLHQTAICELVDTYACDHAKQGLETQIASDNHKDPVSEVTDGCQSAKNVLDDIEKDDTDVTG